MEEELEEGERTTSLDCVKSMNGLAMLEGVCKVERVGSRRVQYRCTLYSTRAFHLDAEQFLFVSKHGARKGIIRQCDASKWDGTTQSWKGRPVASELI